MERRGTGRGGKETINGPAERDTGKKTKGRRESEGKGRKPEEHKERRREGSPLRRRKLTSSLYYLQLN